MSELVDFLLARIAEEEANAADCGGATGCHVPDALVDHNIKQCDAKRMIVKRMGPRVHEHWPTNGGWVLSALALPYADHPDYRREWAIR